MWEEVLKTCDGNIWDNCVRHTNELIKNWYEAEQHLADVDVNPLIINLGEDSDVNLFLFFLFLKFVLTI